MLPSSSASAKQVIWTRLLKRWSLALLLAALAFEFGVLALSVFGIDAAWKSIEKRVHVVAITFFLVAIAIRLVAHRVNPVWSILLLVPGLARFVPQEIRDAVE
mgnify:CR=1 FL=1